MIYDLFNKFDSNEWAVTITLIIFISLFLLLPKRFPLPVTITILLFGAFIARMADVTFFPFDLYDVMDTKKHSVYDLVIYTFCYPFMSYFFCYFYDLWKTKGWYQPLLIVISVAGSLSLEWLGVLANVYSYKGWKLYDSATIYLIVFPLYVLMLNAATKSYNDFIKQ